MQKWEYALVTLNTDGKKIFVNLLKPQTEIKQYDYTVDSLKWIMDWMRDQGWELVNITEKQTSNQE